MEDQTTQKMVVRASPDQCYEVVTDFDSYTEWASDLKEVKILDRDTKKRPSVVSYRAAAFGRSTSYTLSYDYSKAPGELSWVLVEGDLTSKLDGAYVFTASGNGDTEVTYHLVAQLKVPIPGFVKRRAESRIVSTALKNLKSRVESS